MNLFMQYTGISAWYSTYRLQQAMKSGAIPRVGGDAASSANPDTAVNGQRNLSGASRGPYAHPYLGQNLDLII